MCIHNHVIHHLLSPFGVADRYVCLGLAPRDGLDNLLGNLSLEGTLGPFLVAVIYRWVWLLSLIQKLLFENCDYLRYSQLVKKKKVTVLWPTPTDTSLGQLGHISLRKSCGRGSWKIIRAGAPFFRKDLADVFVYVQVQSLTHI